MPSQMQRFEVILSRLPDKERSQLLEVCIELVRCFFNEWRKRHQVRNEPEDPETCDTQP